MRFFSDAGSSYKLNFNKARVTDRDVDELIGVCKGIIFDGSVSQMEIESLLLWLEHHKDICDEWPASVIYPRIVAALEDGVVDDEEEEELLKLIASVAGQINTDSNGGTVDSGTRMPLCDPAPQILFCDSIFVLTGQFACGPRRAVAAEIQDRGGKVSSSPSGKTDYLVIGEIGSKDWMHSTHGRKIEKAIKLRQSGSPVSIVSEKHFFDSLS